ncbi:MAG: PH domain-containing protein [Thermomicrobiales bacterium]|nr:PH domain-containing protein [Thermomicrobiales bacterium]MCO5222215.1 PH domain-containing protein [Thermomicrobiales bacterium]
MSRDSVAEPSPAARVFDSGWIERSPGRRERSWFFRHGLIRGLFWLVPFLVVALLWVFWFEVPFSDRTPVGIVFVGLLVLLFFLVQGILYPRNWQVLIGKREIAVQHGIIRTTQVFLSYDRVQQIDHVSSPTMQRLGLVELVLHTAAGGLKVYALDAADADLIENRIRANQPLVPLLHR